jgi:acyl carrier protein
MDIEAGFEEQVKGLLVSGLAGKFKKVRIARETALQAELGLDSIGVLALVFRFEELFEIDIAQLGIDIDVGKLRTVNDLIEAGREILKKAHAQNVS